MKKIITLLLLALGAGSVSAVVPGDVKVRAERQNAVYKVGETIKFNVSGALDKVIAFKVGDGVKESKFAPLDSKTIEVKAEKPGFVLVTLDLGKDEKGKRIYSYGGAAVEPEKIVPGVKMPADFAEFWQKEVAKMRASKLEVVKCEKIDAKYLPKGFIAFDVEVKRGDIVATGYMVMPANAAKKSLAAVLNFNGASKVSAELPVAIGPAKANNAISFNLNFHGLKNVNLTRQRNRAAEAEMRPLVKNYQFKNAENPQLYAMRKIFLRTVLAADYLKTVPEFDGKRLVAAGGSLGGCQAIVCAALVPDVVLCISNATAMCDHYGKDAGHLPGWPNLFARNRKARAAAAYFDVVNFARLVKCPTRMSVAFLDVICPPATTYAAYNVLGAADKKISHTITGGHGDRWDKKELGVFSHHMRNIKKFLQNY